MTTLLTVDHEIGILTLVQGQMQQEPVWALLALYPSKYDDYEQKINLLEEIHVTDFGKVVECGYGICPSQAEYELFTQKYGADYRFLNEEIL